MRKVLTGIAVVLFCAWAVYPAILTYTFHFGEKATATVAECDLGGNARGRSARNQDTCRGTWRTEGGKTGEGEIYNLDAPDAEGRTFAVRIGPLGPYAHGWERAWPAPAVAAGPLLVLWLLCYFAYRMVYLPSQKAAAEMFAAPGALVVALDAVVRPDGTRHASVEKLPGPPPGHRELDVPGRPPNEADQVTLGKKKDSKRLYQVLNDADGRPLMYLEHRSDRGLQPETVLRDPSGVPYLLARREGEHMLSHRLLDAAGTELAIVKPITPKSLRQLTLRDADGDLALSAARRHGAWVLKPETIASPELRDGLIALLLARYNDIE
ncbi:hypothetical protein BJF79_19105 [Actinomadura sp. CNU-125]|nr:hypothetical protein BJF79_19105 [Actinomadura sp. CNU-125]